MGKLRLHSATLNKKEKYLLQVEIFTFEGGGSEAKRRAIGGQICYAGGLACGKRSSEKGRAGNRKGGRNSGSSGKKCFMSAISFEKGG